MEIEGLRNIKVFPDENKLLGHNFEMILIIDTLNREVLTHKRRIGFDSYDILIYEIVLNQDWIAFTGLTKWYTGSVYEHEMFIGFLDYSLEYTGFWKIKDTEHEWT